MHAVVSLLMLFALMFGAPVHAHDARPVYLQLTELTNGQIDLQWKVPRSLPLQAQPQPVLPASCIAQNEPVARVVGDAIAYRQHFKCGHSLASSVIGLQFPSINPGLSTLLRVQLPGGESFSHILKPGETTWQVPESESKLNTLLQYGWLGVAHIFAGFDHLLFVACLVLVAATTRRIVLAITGFTLAHSVTLSLAAFDLVRLPIAAVEAAIALSIVFLAVELVRRQPDSWTWRYPMLVSVTFGLLHGFGFASVLRDIGLPQTEALLGLLAFNLGVEVGQLVFVMALLSVFYLLALSQRESRVQLMASQKTLLLCGYSVGIIASYWLAERVSGFWV